MERSWNHIYFWQETKFISKKLKDQTALLFLSTLLITQCVRRCLMIWRRITLHQLWQMTIMYIFEIMVTRTNEQIKWRSIASSHQCEREYSKVLTNLVITFTARMTHALRVIIFTMSRESASRMFLSEQTLLLDRRALLLQYRSA